MKVKMGLWISYPDAIDAHDKSSFSGTMRVESLNGEILRPNGRSVENLAWATLSRDLSVKSKNNNNKGQRDGL